MSRRALVGYAGATGRMSIERTLLLGPGFVVQEKKDGSYCHVHLDGRGRIEHVFSRTGRAFSRELLGDLVGCMVGAPGSTLVGEIELHTEAATRAVKTRGFGVIWLFDCIRLGGTYLARSPYQERRDALWRSQSWAENFGPGLPFERDEHGVAHEKASGRFCAAVPRDWRRTPIVDQIAPARAGDLWERAVVGETEGIVVVALAAPAGRRGSKVKCKPTGHTEVVCVSAGRRAAMVHWPATGAVFAISASGSQRLEVGKVYELAFDGYTERTGLPKFPRLVRARPDLQEGVVGT